MFFKFFPRCISYKGSNSIENLFKIRSLVPFKIYKFVLAIKTKTFYCKLINTV